ncbi:anthranilate phosphoribosyltransferase [Pseudonocardia sp. CNS-139]|nr:anthranilate phosphoribosyltransferase [Pseudonocardia sp. CNS-139]
MIDLLRTVRGGGALDEAAAHRAMGAIMRGEATDAQVAGLAMAMAVRGESVDELVGMARAAREAAAHVPFSGDDVLDTCGTGGDGHDTFNVSTAAAVVVAACGVRVAKHGNRSVSSACGSADVLEELGVRIDLGPAAVARCLGLAGVTFLFAPVFHGGFRHAAPARRELGVRTVFNLLGPLCNPARARFQVLGVPDPALAEPLAEVLRRLGVTRALVVHSLDGMDELSVAAPSDVVEIHGDAVRRYRLDPAGLGIARSRIADLAGGDRARNAAIVRAVLAGERGPRRDVVLLNAAAGLLVTGRAADWADGLRRAADAVDSGAAAARLDRWVQASVQAAEPERRAS